MTEERISKKLHSPTGSLARRIILVCLALLVVPLFIHSILLYRIEYREKLADTRLILKVIGKAQLTLIQERGRLFFRRLDAISSLSDPIAQRLNVSAIPLPPGVKGHFILADPQNGIIFGRQMNGEQALAITIPFIEILNQMQIQGSPYPVYGAILSKKDRQIYAGEIKKQSLVSEVNIPNSNFAIALTIPKSAIEELHYQEYIYRFLVLVALIGVIGGSIVALVSRRISKPLRRLCHTMDRVSEGAIHSRYEPDRWGFEINELGKQFNMTLDSLLRLQQTAEKERIEREKLAQELRIGREIQMSLLPTHIPDLDELDIAPGFIPATEVSGDFYDLFPTKEGKLLIVIADTAGKGISACLYALGLRSLIRSSINVKPELSEMLMEANHLFWLDANQSGMFITAWTGIYDRKKRELTYASLGHPPAILKRGDQLIELETKGIALGATEMDLIETKTLSIKKGDLLFLCTDGILEAHDPDGNLFGQKKLNAFLRKIPLHTSSQEIVKNLFSTVQEFSSTKPQHDDMTCLSIQFK